MHVSHTSIQHDVLDQYGLIRKSTIHHIREFEKDSRKRTGLKNGGLRIIDGATSNFIAFVIKQTQMCLRQIRVSDPERYQGILDGHEGEFIGIKINLLRYINCNMLSLSDVMACNDPQAPRRKNGMTPQLDNAYRKLRYIRSKITMNRSVKHANGVVSRGMDFIQKWEGINATGQVDPKGRVGHVAYVNLKYILGPDWSLKFDQKFENQMVKPDPKKNYTEKFSIRDKEILKKEKKKEESGKIEFEAETPQPTETQKTEAPKAILTNTKFLEDQKGVKAADRNSPMFAGNVAGDFLKNMPGSSVLGLTNEKKEDQPPQPAAVPPSGRTRMAIELWTMLYERVYQPMIAEGRVRYNANKIYLQPTFPRITQEQAIEKIEQLLQSFSATMLKKAIEKEAAWLKTAENRWIYTPGVFLDPTLANGTLISAIRELVRPDAPQNRDDIPGENSPADQRIDIWYQKVIDLGCKNTRRHTFIAWANRYGIDYLCRICSMFRSEIHNQRLSGKKAGEEFKQGASKKLAQMMYYGRERINEFLANESVTLKRRLMAQANDPRWTKSIAKVRTLTDTEITDLNRLCHQYLGVRLGKFSEIEVNEKAVMLAWAYETFWFHRA